MTITANDRSMVNLAAVQSAGDLAVRHKVANPVPYKAYTQSLLIVGMCLSIENYVWQNNNHAAMCRNYDTIDRINKQAQPFLLSYMLNLLNI